MTRVVERDGYGGDGSEFDFWRDHAQISLQPVAAPSVLGLFGFAAATFIFSAHFAGWFGDDTTPLLLFPLAALLGGLAQFLAGMWAFRARDTLATAMHGTWGSFWLAYGLLYLLVALGVLSLPTPDPALGYWFIALAAITWSGALAALGQNIGLALVLTALAAGATCMAVGMALGISIWSTIGAYFFIAASVLAWYVATAMMLEWSFKRVILPIGKIGAVSRPGRAARPAIQYPEGEPGVKVGQ
jgi:succinate-acetate transporter protein